MRTKENIIDTYFNKYWFFSGLLLLLIYYIPYMILKDNCFISIHDNLDGVFVNKVLLARSGWILNRNQIIENVMNGLPVTSFGTKISVSFILYKIFNPFNAYLINDILIKIIAFSGMYLFLSKHISRDNNSLSFFLSVIFCFIPFYSAYDLTTAGQPFLYFAIINLIKDKNNIYNYIIILLFTFYSSLVLAGVFIIVIFTIYIIINTIKNKKLKLNILSGLIIFGAGYLISEYQLFLITFFDANFISHRVDWKIPTFTLTDRIKDTVDMLIYNQIHAGHINTIFIIITSLLIVISQFFEKYKIKSIFIKNRAKTVIFLYLAILSILVLYLIYPYIVNRYGNKIEIIKTFQFDRFYFLLPVAWLVVFAICLMSIKEKGFIKIAYFLIVIQFCTVAIGNITYLKNIVYLTNVGLNKIDVKISYKTFFDDELFIDIDNYIGIDKEDYRVVSLGLHPSVATYNGFYSLDSYQNIYPKKYKDKFRKIIEGELNKNEDLRIYFDEWGNRCYLFSSEIDSYLINKEENRVINHFDINTTALKEMGGKYIFSTVKIGNSDSIDLKFLKYFDHEDSYWGIYLYEIL